MFKHESNLIPRLYVKNVTQLHKLMGARFVLQCQCCAFGQDSCILVPASLLLLCLSPLTSHPTPTLTCLILLAKFQKRRPPHANMHHTLVHTLRIHSDRYRTHNPLYNTTNDVGERDWDRGGSSIMAWPHLPKIPQESKLYCNPIQVVPSLAQMAILNILWAIRRNEVMP